MLLVVKNPFVAAGEIAVYRLDTRHHMKITILVLFFAGDKVELAT